MRLYLKSLKNNCPQRNLNFLFHGRKPPITETKAQLVTFVINDAKCFWWFSQEISVQLSNYKITKRRAGRKPVGMHDSLWIYVHFPFFIACYVGCVVRNVSIWQCLYAIEDEADPPLSCQNSFLCMLEFTNHIGFNVLKERYHTIILFSPVCWRVPMRFPRSLPDLWAVLFNCH